LRFLENEIELGNGWPKERQTRGESDG